MVCGKASSLLELLKIMVQPVVLERDADGHIVGEKTGEPIALYDLERVADYVEQLQREIDNANAAARQT